MRRLHGWGRGRHWVYSMALVLVAGCGPSAKPPAPKIAEPEADSNPPPAAPAAQVAAQLRPAAPDKKKKPASAVTAATDPRDVFEVAEREPGFDVIGAGGNQPTADIFSTKLPPRGVDSTQFLVDLPPEQTAPKKLPVQPHKTTEEPAGRHSSRGPLLNRFASSSSAARKSGSKLKERTSSHGKLAEGSHGKKTEKTEPREEHTEQKGPLPEGFSPIDSAGQSPLGLPLRIRCEKDGSEMALVTGGAATVGHNGDPPESSPQITVVLDSFYMDRNEVTLRQYDAFRNAIREEKGRNQFPPADNAASGPDYPALGVTLLQAQFYGRWAGKELPTEAEWELAARGEGAFDHPWGNGRAIWKHDRRLNEIDPVRSFKTDLSPFGIYDMAGNAREWCIDFYSPTAFSEAQKGSSGQLRNWKGPRKAKTEGFHVVKGNGPNWNVWYRRGMDSTERHPNVGFRCVLRLAAEKPQLREQSEKP